MIDMSKNSVGMEEGGHGRGAIRKLVTGSVLIVSAWTGGQDHTPEKVCESGSTGMVGVSKGKVQMNCMKEAAPGTVGVGKRAMTEVITMLMMLAMEAIMLEVEIVHMEEQTRIGTETKAMGRTRSTTPEMKQSKT